MDDCGRRLRGNQHTNASLMLPGFGLDLGSPASWGYGATISVLVLTLPPNTLDLAQASAVIVEMSIAEAVELGIDLSAPIIVVTFAAPDDPIVQTGTTVDVVKFADTQPPTDDGITGWGECYASSVGPRAMEAVISDVFERHFLDENPENIELLFRRTYSAGFTQRADLTVMGAFSGLEIACWDILGKARDRPVWALLGGKMNDRVRAYSYIYPLPHHNISDFWTSPDMAAEAALDLVDRGYTAVKVDPAGPYTMRGGHQPPKPAIHRYFIST